MVQKKKVEDLSLKIEEALKKASRKVLEEQKAINGYMVVAGINGKVEKIPARTL